MIITSNGGRKVPREIIRNHSDIFNFDSSLLIMALLQLWGSEISLAEGWKQNSEESKPLASQEETR